MVLFGTFILVFMFMVLLILHDAKPVADHALVFRIDSYDWNLMQFGVFPYFFKKLDYLINLRGLVAYILFDIYLDNIKHVL